MLVEQGQMDTFHREKQQYWNSCVEGFNDFLVFEERIKVLWFGSLEKGGSVALAVDVGETLQVTVDT